MNKHKNKGFTLIELLVVISIISLLSSIFFSASANVRDKGYLARLRGDAHSILTQVEIARSTYNKPLSGIVGDCPGCGAAGGVKLVDQYPWVISSNNDAWRALGFPTAPKDPWGSPYIMRVKEHD